MSEKGALPVVQVADGMLFGVALTIAGAPPIIGSMTPTTAFCAVVAASFAAAQSWEGMIERTAEAYQ